jgi:hypothetical protein
MSQLREFTATISLFHMTGALRRTVQQWIDRAQAQGWQTRAETTKEQNPFGEFRITFTPPVRRLGNSKPRKVN